MKGLWQRFGDRVYLCGTLGADFDQRQRQLAAISAADAYRMQTEGLQKVEELMDRLEAEARKSVEADGARLLPRKSPGYNTMPLELSREIIDRLDATRRIGVAMTDSQLLVPSKSVTAICEVVTA